MHLHNASLAPFCSGRWPWCGLGRLLNWVGGDFLWRFSLGLGTLHRGEIVLDWDGGGWVIPLLHVDYQIWLILYVDCIFGLLSI